MVSLRLLIRSAAIVLLGVMLAEIINRESSCEMDPAFYGHSTCDFFAENYKEARSKFRNALKVARGELHTFPVVDGADYTMDIGVIKGNMPDVVIHTSGYHGVEGYAGSAIQVAWLLQSLDESNKDQPSVILVHAVNPYGFSHYRRTNENNVDLNRNGLHELEWRTVLERDPNIANYETFRSLFNPQRAPTTWDRYVGVWFQAARAIYKHGLAALKRGMVSGQYHDSQGIFYGGNQLEPSLHILWNFLESQLPKLKRKKGLVTMINVHTGLGPSGEDSLLTPLGSNISPTLLNESFTGSHIVGLAQEANDVAAGYDVVTGHAEHFFAKLVGSGWILTQEFGTVSSLFVGVALILENMARHYLIEEEAEEWTLLTRKAFYVQTPSWRRNVLTRGLRVFHQAIGRSSQKKRN